MAPRSRWLDDAAPCDDAARCAVALHAYLDAVAQALARRDLGVAALIVSAHGPQQAWGGRLVLDPAGTRAVTPQPERGRGPIAAVWHEELGWWAELAAHPGAQGGPRRRYLPPHRPTHAPYPTTVPGPTVAPYPTLVADFLAGLTRGDDIGATSPMIHRYRWGAAPTDLPALLNGPTPATPAPLIRAPAYPCTGYAAVWAR